MSASVSSATDPPAIDVRHLRMDFPARDDAAWRMHTVVPPRRGPETALAAAGLPFALEAVQ